MEDIKIFSRKSSGTFQDLLKLYLKVFHLKEDYKIFSRINSKYSQGKVLDSLIFLGTRDF